MALYYEKLKKYMAEQKLEAKQLGDTIGVPAHTIYKYMSGQYKPKLKNAVKICDMLGSTLEEMDYYKKELKCSKAKNRCTIFNCWRSGTNICCNFCANPCKRKCLNNHKICNVFEND